MPIRQYVSQPTRTPEQADAGTPTDPGIPADTVAPDLGDGTLADSTHDGSPNDVDGYDSAEDSGEVDDSAIVDFLVAYFNIVESPSDEQVHSLATAMGVTPEELESHIFNMVHETVEEDDAQDSDDTDVEEDEDGLLLD